MRASGDVSGTSPASLVPPAEGGDREREHHASWTELFFDLAAAAGVSTTVQEVSGEQLGRDIVSAVVHFSAFWLVWACFTTYGNLALEKARRSGFAFGTLLLCAMAVAASSHQPGHMTAFALTYATARFIAASPWRDARLVVDLPVAQAAAGVVPWIVSVWLAPPWRDLAWCLGLTVDLLGLWWMSEARVVKRWSSASARAAARTPIELLRGEIAHLRERMGLLIVIILGEALVGMVAQMRGGVLDASRLVGAVGAYVLLFAMFLLAVDLGAGGVALFARSVLPNRLLWILHWFTSLALVGLAAALERTVSSAAEGATALALGATFALYTLVSASAHAVVWFRTRARASLGRAVGLCVLGTCALTISVLAAPLWAKPWAISLLALVGLYADARAFPMRHDEPDDPGSGAASGA